ncbi:MAG: sulfate ABC transporter permease subunit CysT [Ancalomicrobiaceae bacterium]|nr:sulfate ABC transporter permease subunit CysT [Ancalomicrobiaceae bacterium]
MSATAGSPSLHRWPNPGILPGFGLSLGFTLLYLALIVLLPLAALAVKASGLGFHGFWAIAADPRVVASLKLSFGISLLAAAINAVFGLLVAWVLVRYDFPGKRIVDAIVDLPFALPTAVAGIALATLYAPKGWIGRIAEVFGLKIAYTPVGIAIALVFIGLPFVVRTVQPVLADLDQEIEEAAATLGASRFLTIRRVILPPLIPAVITGFALAFARGVGEYGSVIFIAGNMPFVSEITPLLVVIKLEGFDLAGATCIALAMLGISFVMLLAINMAQALSRRRFGHV